jgi:hypothetical protein
MTEPAARRTEGDKLDDLDPAAHAIYMAFLRQAALAAGGHRAAIMVPTREATRYAAAFAPLR